MKNSQKNNFSQKNRKHNRNNTNPNFYSKNTNSSSKNRFPINSAKNQVDKNFSESDKKKVSFLYQKSPKPINKSNKEFSIKSQDTYHELSNKNFDDWIWGKHSVYEALIVRELLIEFGVHQFFLQEILYFTQGS